MADKHEDEVRQRISSSSTVNFMIGTFLTIISGILVYNGMYILIILFILLVIYGIWKLWKDGEFKEEGTIGGLFMFFFSIPMCVYLMIGLIKKGIYAYPIVIGLMLLPGIFQLFRNFIKEVRGK